jgi:hypothetical protein
VKKSNYNIIITATYFIQFVFHLAIACTKLMDLILMMLAQDTDDCPHRLRVCFEISLHHFLHEDNKYSTYIVRYYCFDLFGLMDGSY